jgi:outer membrane protein TolC
MSVAKTIVLAAVWWLAFFPAMARAGDIPLPKAVQKGIELDAQYNNHRLARRQADLEIQKAKNNRRFTVDAAGSYRFQSDQMEISMPDISPAPGLVIPGVQISAGAKHNYDLKLSLLQPIYTGNILSQSIHLNRQAAAVRGWDVILRKVQVAGQIKTSYYTCRLLESKEKSLLLLIENLGLHYKRLADYFEEDLVKKSDLLETEVKINEAEMNLEQVRRQMEEEKISFHRLTSFHIHDIEAGYREDAAGFEDSFARFSTTHPALKQLEHHIRMQGSRKKIIAGNYLPRVMGFAELHYGRPGIDFFQNRWSFYFQGGINVQVKVFDWNRRHKDSQIVDADIGRLKNRKKEIVNDVKKQFMQLYARKRSLERQLQKARKLAAIAAEDAALKKELYNENQAANIDYLAALLTKERYQSMQQELNVQVQLVNVGINLLVGGEK